MQKHKPMDELHAGAARAFNHTTPAQWWSPRPAIAATPTFEWSGSALDEASRPANRHLENIDPSAWASVRAYILELTRGKQ
jgi:hypothetical protein